MRTIFIHVSVLLVGNPSSKGTALPTDSNGGGGSQNSVPSPVQISIFKGGSQNSSGKSCPNFNFFWGGEGVNWDFLTKISTTAASTYFTDSLSLLWRLMSPDSSTNVQGRPRSDLPNPAISPPIPSFVLPVACGRRRGSCGRCTCKATGPSSLTTLTTYHIYM